MKKIDLNCDMGESFGAYTMGQDERVMEHITSANIACGFHAGDPGTIAQTIQMALEHNVRIGAHPGYPDLVGFGRRALDCSPREIYDMVLYQVSAVKGMCHALGGTLQHVKPHGALYNLAAQDTQVALAIAEALYAVDPDAILFGLAQSELTKAGEQLGLKVAHEVFADRTYRLDGSLTPRSHEHAVLHTVEQAIAQVLEMITKGQVSTLDGHVLQVQADTICIHGDHPTALQFVEQLHHALLQAEVTVEAVSLWKV